MNCQKAILDKKNTSRKIKSLILNSNYTIEAIANMLELAVNVNIEFTKNAQITFTNLD